jgi:hypothetical protein
MATSLSKDQIAAINTQVAAATIKLNAFIENDAGMFAGAVERDIATAKGKQLILDIIENTYISGWDDGAKAAAAAGKLSPEKLSLGKST